MSYKCKDCGRVGQGYDLIPMHYCSKANGMRDTLLGNDFLIPLSTQEEKDLKIKNSSKLKRLYYDIKRIILE